MENKSPKTAADGLTLAVGLLVRRLRSEGSSEERPWSHLATLSRLEEHGWMTTADLARSVVMTSQSMGSILQILEAEGLVQRRPHPTDRRQVLLGLTDAGIEVRRERKAAKREWLSEAIGRLSAADQEVLSAAIPLIRDLAEPKIRRRRNQAAAATALPVLP